MKNMEWVGDMNRKVVKYKYQGDFMYLDPNSLAYTLYKENKIGELDKHLESIMRKK